VVVSSAFKPENLEDGIVGTFVSLTQPWRDLKEVFLSVGSSVM
jgi:hypothetical protein